MLLVGILLAVGAACGMNRSGNLIETPFPGVVIGASTVRPTRCADGRCFANYAIRITNPTGGDASVLMCHLDEGQDEVMGRLNIQVGMIGGAWVPAGSTRTVRFSSSLPVSIDDLARMPGLTVTCQGIDRHGNPPV